MTNRAARVLAAIAAVALSSAGCRQRVDAIAYRDESACVVLDSLFAAAGPPRPLTFAGRAVLDVEQFRFDGRFRLAVTAAGECTMELGGSTLFGGHREDLVVSLVGDTLRVLDRERGQFYEGEALDEMIEDTTDARAPWAAVVARVLTPPGACESIETLGADADGVRGAGPHGTFRVDLERGRVTRAVWPDPIGGGTFDDRLDVRYRWRGAELTEITARLPARGWRVRLTDSK